MLCQRPATTTATPLFDENSHARCDVRQVFRTAMWWLHVHAAADATHSTTDTAAQTLNSFRLTPPSYPPPHTPGTSPATPARPSRSARSTRVARAGHTRTPRTGLLSAAVAS